MNRKMGNSNGSGLNNVHWHQKPVCPMQSFLWSMFFIQRWFSNKISLDYYQHKSSPQWRRSGNSILGNAVWGKVNLVAALFPETWSCVFVSFIHIDMKWGIFFKTSYWDVTNGFNYLHIHEMKESLFSFTALQSYCLTLVARDVCDSVRQALLKNQLPHSCPLWSPLTSGVMYQ